MSPTRYERLIVYQLAVRIADHAWRIVHKWDSFARETMGAQLVRAADSVGANLAEGSGRDSRRDNLRFISYARGSLYEVRHFIELAERRGVACDELGGMKRCATELALRLNAYRRAVRLRVAADSEQASQRDERQHLPRATRHKPNR
jgi:four helix bundle protein